MNNSTINNLFNNNKFAPKKTKPREQPALSSLARSCNAAKAQEEYGMELGPPLLKLAPCADLIFDEEGQWTLAGTRDAVETPNKEIEKLTKKNKQLTKENEMLKYKVEILLDMLTDATADLHIQEKKISDLKPEVNKKAMKKMIG